MDHLLIWLGIGLAAGWITRSIMTAHREYGVLGDLVTGCLGAVVGGWLTRKAGVLAPDNLVGHAFIAVTGAVVLLAAVRGLRLLWPAAGLLQARSPSSESNVPDGQMRPASDFMRGLAARFLEREITASDPNQAFDTQMTVGERVADKVASFGGSLTFIGLFFISMISWMAINEDLAAPLDPFPFILLNLILSCLAAIQAPVIMMSQNRQAVRDRLEARTDYEVNLRAEVEIMALHAKLDATRNEEMAALIIRMEALAQHLARIESLIENERPSALSPG